MQSRLEQLINQLVQAYSEVKYDSTPYDPKPSLCKDKIEEICSLMITENYHKTVEREALKRCLADLELWIKTDYHNYSKWYPSAEEIHIICRDPTHAEALGRVLIWLGKQKISDVNTRAMVQEFPLAFSLYLPAADIKHESEEDFDLEFNKKIFNTVYHYIKTEKPDTSNFYNTLSSERKYSRDEMFPKTSEAFNVGDLRKLLEIHDEFRKEINGFNDTNSMQEIRHALHECNFVDRTKRYKDTDALKLSAKQVYRLAYNCQHISSVPIHTWQGNSESSKQQIQHLLERQKEAVSLLSVLFGKLRGEALALASSVKGDEFYTIYINAIMNVDPQHAGKIFAVLAELREKENLNHDYIHMMSNHSNIHMLCEHAVKKSKDELIELARGLIWVEAANISNSVNRDKVLFLSYEADVKKLSKVEILDTPVIRERYKGMFQHILDVLFTEGLEHSLKRKVDPSLDAAFKSSLAESNTAHTQKLFKPKPKEEDVDVQAAQKAQVGIPTYGH